MKILNDFKCAKGHMEEYFVDSSVNVVTCRHCGNDATKMMAAPRSKLEGITGAFPDAYERWNKVRQSHINWERKTGRSDQYK
jgi:hypothetical protein